ncbi:MAG: hypothetical protein HKO66_05750 [Saprospiraceae bacterium]|nr:hypothetical protein [Bacteroidia bacterium]NNE14751.1 hypothetical protein [Saprospiraceae bacterium]NNL91714.1 hypothetical protein [Saprospiraceae bacterium]
MKKLNVIGAFLLAIPLIVFGSNYFIDMIPKPPDDGSIGLDMLETMRSGGMMVYVALGHIIIGLMLIFKKTRYVASILQLPISLAIVFFNYQCNLEDWLWVY